MGGICFLQLVEYVHEKILKIGTLVLEIDMFRETGYIWVNMGDSDMGVVSGDEGINCLVN